jgi:hypothetical protein
VLSKSYVHKNNCKKSTCGEEKRKKKEKEKHNSTDRNYVSARVFNAGLLARSQFASLKSCDRPTQSRFSVVFLGPRANSELVSNFHVALLASHAALPMVTLQISPYTIVTFTFDFWLDHPVRGDMGEDALY